MELNSQPLVYYAEQENYDTHYLGAQRPTDKQVVFVGDTKRIYTHGVMFDCNNYNDSEVRGLISGLDTKIDNSVSTLNGLIDGVSDDLDAINNWSQEDINNSITGIVNSENWINAFITNNNIQTGTPFTITDVDNHLKAVGLLNSDGTLGWSTLQQNYNSIYADVTSLKEDSDYWNGLESSLKAYVDDEIAGINFDTRYIMADADTNAAIAWLKSGFSAGTSQNNTFAEMYSAAFKDWSDDISTATATVKTDI